MQVTITARNCKVNENLRGWIEEQLLHLKRFEPRALRLEVTLLEEKNGCRVEALATVARAGMLHAEAGAEDFRSAVDRVVEKLARQLRKGRSRRREHQGNPPLSGAASISEDEA